MTTTLDTGDATIHYELRGDGPLPVLVGAPMDADAFAGAAELLAAGHTDEHFQFAHMLRGTVRWRPDPDTLRATPVRLLIGFAEDPKTFAARLRELLGD